MVLEIVPQPAPAQLLPVSVQVTPLLFVSRPNVATNTWVWPSSIEIGPGGETWRVIMLLPPPQPAKNAARKIAQKTSGKVRRNSNLPWIGMLVKFQIDELFFIRANAFDVFISP